jgi:hypothetical protein
MDKQDDVLEAVTRCLDALAQFQASLQRVLDALAELMRKEAASWK